MKEKQMTIDDYLNDNNIEFKDMNKKESAEVIKPEVVSYDNLTKEELLNVVWEKDKVLHHYEDKLNNMEESHKAELNNLNDFYSKRVQELTHLINYYERKINIIRDIINIETGGEK